MSDLIASLRALATAQHDDLSVAADAAEEISRLRKALEPLANLYLWPDDLGQEVAQFIRSEDDWCEQTNEDADRDVLIKRKYIRAAREALGIKEDGR